MHKAISQQQWRPLGMSFGFGSHIYVACMGCGFGRSWDPNDRAEGFRAIRETLDHVESCPKVPPPMVPDRIPLDPNGGPTAVIIVDKGVFIPVYEQHGGQVPEGTDPATVLRPGGRMNGGEAR